MGESSRSHSHKLASSLERARMHNSAHTAHMHAHASTQSYKTYQLKYSLSFVFKSHSIHVCTWHCHQTEKAAQRPEEATLSPLSFPVCVCADACVCAALAVVSRVPFGFRVLLGDRISRWLAVQQIRYMPVSTTQRWDWDYKSVLCFPLKNTYSLVI